MKTVDRNGSSVARILVLLGFFIVNLPGSNILRPSIRRRTPPVTPFPLVGQYASPSRLDTYPDLARSGPVHKAESSLTV